MKKTAIILSCVLLSGVCNNCSKNEYNLFGALYGTVTDSETGDRLANASVVLSPGAGGKTKITGDDGRFEFVDLDAMQYMITVQKTGYQINRITVTAVPGERTEANIPLTKSN